MMLLAASLLAQIFRWVNKDGGAAKDISYLGWHGADGTGRRRSRSCSRRLRTAGTGCARWRVQRRLMTWFSSRRLSWRSCSVRRACG